MQLLADDFYGWQSGSRRAAATANETTRTLLGGGQGLVGRSSSNDKAPGRRGVAAAGVGRGEDVDRSWEGGGGGGGGGGGVKNPVRGGFQRLRNVRGPGGGGDVATAGRGEAKPAVTTTMPRAVDQASLEALQAWATDGVKGDSFEVGVGEEGGDDRGERGGETQFEVEVEEGAGEDGPAGDGRQQRRRGGWGRGGFGGGGGGPINWWG